MELELNFLMGTGIGIGIQISELIPALVSTNVTMVTAGNNFVVRFNHGNIIGWDMISHSRQTELLVLFSKTCLARCS